MVSSKQDPEAVVKVIRHQTRRKFSTANRIRIVIEGLFSKVHTTESPRSEGIVANLYCRRSKEFLKAGRKWMQ